MLTPQQFQDLSIIFDTSVEELEKLYKISDIDITDEMAICDVLSGDINESDFMKLKEILQNYPLFDNILLKIRVISEVLSINDNKYTYICEYITPKVIESFKGTPLYNIFEQIDFSLSVDEQNKQVREKILETISPKKYLKPILNGTKTFRKSLNESSIINMSKKELKTKLHEMYFNLFINTPLYARNKDNISWNTGMNEYKSMKRIYESMYGTFNEDLIKPIKPIGVGGNNTNSQNNANNTNNDGNNSNGDNISDNSNNNSSNNNSEQLLNNGEINVDELKTTIENMDDNELSDLYREMDDDELSKQMKAIEELLK